MAMTFYRGYRVWHDRTHEKCFAVIWPPDGPPEAVLEIINTTPRQGELALMRRVRAFIDVEESKKQSSRGAEALRSGPKAKQNG
jgi:hypothetical protein